MQLLFTKIGPKVEISLFSGEVRPAILDAGPGFPLGRMHTTIISKRRHEDESAY